MSSLMFVYNLSVADRNDLITEPNIIIIALWIVFVQNSGVPKINRISFHRASTIHQRRKGREGARSPVSHDFRCSISVLAFPRSQLLYWTVYGTLDLSALIFKKNGTPWIAPEMTVYWRNIIASLGYPGLLHWFALMSH